MRVNVVRITIATIGALCVGLVAVAVPPAAADASTSSIPAPNGPGLRAPRSCTTTSPGGVPAVLYAQTAQLSAGYWFEECRVGNTVHLRNLTPAVWTIDLMRSGAFSPRPTRAAVVARYELFHSQYLPASLFDVAIAPGETLVFQDVDQFVLTHDLTATAAWLATRSTTKWIRDVARIDVRKELFLAVAARQGTGGALLADCYGAAETISEKRTYLSSDDVLARNAAAVYIGMKSQSCLRALRAFHGDPTITREAESGAGSLLATVTRSVGETASVSAFERFAPVLKAVIPR
jgi:hypothetical protein